MTRFTLSLILISALLLLVTPAFANDCDPTVDYNMLGHTQYEQGEYTAAAASFTCAIQADPEASRVYNARGNAYRGLSDYVSAIADYDKAIEIDDEYAIAYNNRGWSYFKLDNEDKAMEDYNKALELDPNLSYAYNNRGLIFQLNGKAELASADFNRAIELNPSFSWAEYNLGLLQAVPASETNTETTARNSEAVAYVSRGLAAKDDRDWTQAVELFTKALELDPDNFATYFSRGKSYLALDQFEAAFADFSRVMELNPDYVYGYWARAAIAAELGDFDQARADAAAGYQLDPERINNVYVAGTIASLAGDPMEAGKQFYQVLETYETEPIVHDPIKLGATVILQMRWHQIDAFPFEGEAGQTLHIEANTTELDSLIVLLDQDGNPIAGDDDSGQGLSASIRAVELPEDGTYTLLVTHAGAGYSGDIEVTIMLADG